MEFDDILYRCLSCLASDCIYHMVEHLATAFESVFNWLKKNRDTNDHVMYICCIFTNRLEDSCMAVVIRRDLLVFVDDYRRKKVEQRTCLYAPHCEEKKKDVRKVHLHSF